MKNRAAGQRDPLESLVTKFSFAFVSLPNLYSMAKTGRKNLRILRDLNRVRKDLKSKKGGGGGRTLSRRNASVVLAQGVGAVPKKNFGTRMSGRMPSRRSGCGSLVAMKRALDARIPRTLGLPRAVGPYTVIRTTVLHTSSAEFIMFCPFQESDFAPNSAAGPLSWVDICGIEDVVGSNDITAPDNTRPIRMPMLGLGAACEVVPAALTVQVLNPNSLQNAEGVFAMARVNQQLSLGNSPAGLTWREMGARVISFYSPRLLSGGKLAIRGVKCSAYPLDMSEYSQFAPVKAWPAQPFHWNLQTSNGGFRPAALSPIVFVQENAIAQTIEFLVTIEWRVRFDPGNPATASHTYHDTLPDEAWNGLIKSVSNAGSGVEELSEDVATLGGAI